MTTSVAATTLMSSRIANAAAAPTVSFNVLYPNQAGARFDTGYYRSTHIRW